MKKIFIRLIKILPAFVLFIMIFAITFMGISAEDKTYSRMENRTLQQFPKLSKQRLLKGKFQNKYETYLSDQFPKRDTWVQIMSVSNRMLGRTEANGVYFGKKDYLLEHHTEKDFNEKTVNKNIKALQKFVKSTKKTAKVKVMMVPSKTQILRDYLPAFAESYDETIFYKKLEQALSSDVLIPVSDDLQKHKKETIFYKTDHHWTTLGAWYGYKSYLKSCGKSTKPADNKKEWKKVSQDFLGTTHSKVNMYSTADTIFIYEPSAKMKVIYNLGEKTEHSFYQNKFLKEKDKYSVFFGGNQALLEISGGKKNGKTLLMIKDSFANCMIPFLAEDFEKVVVADMRQLNVGISMLLRSYQPTDVLILYNNIQFMQDTEFSMKAK